MLSGPHCPITTLPGANDPNIRTLVKAGLPRRTLMVDVPVTEQMLNVVFSSIDKNSFDICHAIFDLSIKTRWTIMPPVLVFFLI